MSAVSGNPFPRYLIDQTTRSLIRALEETGFDVTVTAPGPGSVAVAITSPQGVTREEVGRPDDLEATLRQVADESGVEL